jgi:predicted HTH domain antitoxin
MPLLQPRSVRQLLDNRIPSSSTAMRTDYNDNMTINLPAELEKQISREEAALHLAIGLFAGDKVTLGQAASIAGISQPAFMHELGKRKIPLHYGIDELEQDIATVKNLASLR